MLSTELQNVLNRKGDRTMNGKEAITCRRCNGSSVNLFFIGIIVVLLLIVQPVGAFTAPRSTIGLGLYRRSVQNQNSTTSHKIGENEEHGLEQKTHASAIHKVFVSPLQKVQSWNDKVRTAYRKRTNADPSFFAKSVTEVLVAAGTQLMAEWNRRGASRMVSELDFVVPAVLTAVFGKYYRWVSKKMFEGNIATNFVSQIYVKLLISLCFHGYCQCRCIWKIGYSYEVVGSTRKGAICLDRSRNPIVLCALHPLCLSRRNTFDFLRDLNDASILDLNLPRGVIDSVSGFKETHPCFWMICFR